MSYLDDIQTIGHQSDNNDPFNDQQTNRANTPSTANESVDMTFARLSREQFADSQRRYYPFEEMTRDMLLEGGARQAYRQEGIDITNRAVNSSLEAAEQRVATTRSRTNQMQDSRSKIINDRSSQLDRTAAGITARNSTRRYMDERELELIGG